MLSSAKASTIRPGAWRAMPLITRLSSGETPSLAMVSPCSAWMQGEAGFGRQGEFWIVADPAGGDACAGRPPASEALPRIARPRVRCLIVWCIVVLPARAAYRATRLSPFRGPLPRPLSRTRHDRKGDAAAAARVQRAVVPDRAAHRPPPVPPAPRGGLWRCPGGDGRRLRRAAAGKAPTRLASASTSGPGVPPIAVVAMACTIMVRDARLARGVPTHASGRGYARDRPGYPSRTGSREGPL